MTTEPDWLPAVRAISLDVDGTLYPLGWRVWVRAAFLPGAMRSLRLIKRARETLRGQTFASAEALWSALDERVAHAGHVTTQEARALRQRVDSVVMPALVAGLLGAQTRAALDSLHQAGVTLVAFSDHATAEKVQALGVAHLFAATISAEQCGAYKPASAGFSRVTAACGVAAATILHVGDRADSDGEGALGAGLRAALVAGAHPLAAAWMVPSVADVAARMLAARRR